MSLGYHWDEILKGRIKSRNVNVFQEYRCLSRKRKSCFCITTGTIQMAWNENGPVGVIKTSMYPVQIITSANRWWNKWRRIIPLIVCP